MTARDWKAWGTVGLLAMAGFFAGCDERQDREIRRDAREVGRQVGDTARDVGQATQEAVEGFKEGVEGKGVGGSGLDEHQPVRAPDETRPVEKTPRHDDESPRTRK